MVFFGHLFGAFLLKTITGFDIPTYLFPLQDGVFAVNVFFVVSGYSLSIAYFQKNSTSPLAHMALRRYFRLAVPVLASSFLSYILLSFGLMHNQDIVGIAAKAGQFMEAQYYHFDASWNSLLRFSLYEVFFCYQPNATFNTVLWTMGTEFMGSYLVFIMLSIFGESSRRNISYAVVFFFFIHFNSHMAAFIAGTFLADIHNPDKSPHKNRTIAYILEASFLCVFATSLLLARHWQSNIPGLILAASAFVYCGERSFLLRKLFECRLAMFFGRLSFPLYLIHMLVICSLTSWLYGLMHGTFNEYVVVLICGTMTIFVCFYVSKIFYPVEKFSIDLGRYFSKLLLS